jgi:hypothetical protein
MRLDLLVDGELAGDQRADLVRQVGQEPTSLSRDVAVRFLEHQTERQTVRQLMAGGRVVPVELVEKPSPFRAQGVRVRWRIGGVYAAAAGLLVAVTSVAVTYYIVTPHTKGGSAAAAEFSVALPREAVPYDRAIPVTVPVVNVQTPPTMFPAADDPHVTKQSLVITTDSRGRAVVIPVNTLKAAVY